MAACSRPTEAGAIGALGALVLILLRGRFTQASLMTMLLDTGKACASIFFLLITAQMYSRMLTLSRLPETLTQLGLGARRAAASSSCSPSWSC